ncbi:hypothetical protein OAS39_11105 [Pirellulales bacterium]|nr:hypothetical protein [Pirellulales bacterium]
MGYFERPKVETRDDLEAVLFNLMDDNDAVVWKNDSAFQLLQAMAAWLHEAEDYYQHKGIRQNPNQASWQLFADMLLAASEPQE